MCWEVTIGNYRLGMIESVKIKRSVELLSDTAIITLPSTVYNKPIEDLKKISRGNKVLIKLGYNDKLETEFEGYVESVKFDNDSFKINCEDSIFLYRDVALENTQLDKSPNVKSILQYVNSKVTEKYEKQEDATKKGKYELECDYNFTYDTYVIKGQTAYDVLKKIQEEAKPNIYMKDKVLHVHPKYAKIYGQIQTYDFSVNIEESDLKFENELDRNVQVEIEYKDKAGKPQKITVGTEGGEKITRKTFTTDPKNADLLAKEELKDRVFTGYSGSFTGWLIPYCDAGYEVQIRDPEDKSKNGNYYVLAVEVDFSQNGGKRKITIGKKLSDGTGKTN